MLTDEASPSIALKTEVSEIKALVGRARLLSSAAPLTDGRGALNLGGGRLYSKDFIIYK